MQNKAMDELILFLLDEINKTDGIFGITEYRLNKVLYKLKRELPEDHPLKETIPYYWYFHGPFSESLRHEIPKLYDYLIKEDYKGSNLFKLMPGIKVNYTVIDDEVYKIISKLLNKDVFYNIDRIVYDEFAPYDFMPTYKFDFLNSIEAYQYSLLADKEDTDLIEKAIKLCYRCEAKLPLDVYFLDFQDLFSDFITSLDLLSRNKVNKYYSKEIHDNAWYTWYTFGYGLRVKHHNAYYEDMGRIEEWDQKFKSELKSLDMHLDNLNEMARDNSTGEENIKFSETSQKILSSSLGTYLLCDKHG